MACTLQASLLCKPLPYLPFPSLSKQRLHHSAFVSSVHSVAPQLFSAPISRPLILHSLHIASRMHVVESVGQNEELRDKKEAKWKFKVMVFLMVVWTILRKGVGKVLALNWFIWWLFWHLEKLLQKLIVEADANPMDVSMQRALLSELNKHRLMGVAALQKYVGSLGGIGTSGVGSSSSYAPKELNREVMLEKHEKASHALANGRRPGRATITGGRRSGLDSTYGS